jgi:hypothetical protein
MPVNDNTNKRYLHIHLCDALNDNDESRVWQPTGEVVRFKSHQGGYGTDAYEMGADIDCNGVSAGHGKGFVSAMLKDGGDQVARDIIEKLRQGRVEVIWVYRQFEQLNGVWENTKTVVSAGYFASAALKAGPCSISLECHINAIWTLNESIGADDYQVDCVNGTSTIKGGDLGPRTLKILDCPGTAINASWTQALITG